MAVPTDELKHTNGDAAKATTDTAPEEEPGSRLEYKHVDEIYDPQTGNWNFRDSAPYVIKTDGAYAPYCFTINRKFDYEGKNPEVTVDIKSPALVAAGSAVVGNIQGLSWHAPARVDPQVLLTFLPDFNTYLESLDSKPSPTSLEVTIKQHLPLLLSYLNKEHTTTLSHVSSLLSHSEITFDLAWSVFVPRSILLTTCSITSQLRAVRLLSATRVKPALGAPYWDLGCEYIDAAGEHPNQTQKKKTGKFGVADIALRVGYFRGISKIVDLDAFPIKWHPQKEEITKMLVERGRKWASLDGIHHMEYNGLAFMHKVCRWIRVSIKSRIMLDKETFKRLNPNYPVVEIKGNISGILTRDSDNDEEQDILKPSDDIFTNGVSHVTDQLTPDDLLLASPILYGFSLSDKLWLEFDVDQVRKFEWNDDAFKQLVLPPAQKDLIQSLVESHSQRGADFDDFIKGKGRGLIINLFGPPGIGKTLSAESASEHVHKPLYVIGAGDLGTNAGNLDRELTAIFDVAQSWNAVVLIDEADVFLEARSVDDLQRNALVAVFLRQLEYFQGILFLTTNRVKTFDEAFESRIHVALRYRELGIEARAKIWKAFFEKARVGGGVSEGEIAKLSERKINGRQIKNAVRTAQALAINKKEELAYGHFVTVLDVMEQFQVDFREE